MALTAEINKNPKLLMNFKKPQVKTKQSRKKSKAGGLVPSNFKLLTNYSNQNRDFPRGPVFNTQCFHC